MMQTRDNNAEFEQTAAVSGTVEQAVSPQAVIVEDEYGDPVIQGTYAGRDQLNLDALLPGRREDGEEVETEDVDIAAAAAKEAAKLAEKQATARALIGITIGAYLLVWFFLSSIPRSEVITRAEKAVPTTQVAATKSTIPATFDTVLNAAVDRSNHADPTGAEFLFEQCAALAKTRDQAMQLVGFADKFVASNQPQLAELFYRRALQVLGLSSGPTSWEYMQSLSKLALFCRHMHRDKEADDIDLYVVRLNARPANQTYALAE